MKAMLRLKNISVVKKGRVILNNIDFGVNKGEKILINGKSGCGKTTLLKSILFFEWMTGEILFNGKKTTHLNIHDYRRNFVYIGQKAPSFAGSVREYLNLPFEFMYNVNQKPDDSVITGILEYFSFHESVLEQDYNSLSGGEQQRITIIQSLLLDKPVYLLDETTSHLDEDNTRKVIDAVNRKNSRTVISVSHNAQWLSKSTKIYDLKNGRLDGRRI